MIHNKFDHDKTIIVDDSTWACLHARDILSIIPRACFIFIRRNPLDVVRSFTEQRWMPDDVKECYNCYQKLINRWKTQKQHLPGTRFVEIHFEDLIKKPKMVFDDVYEKTGIKLHDTEQILSRDKTHNNLWELTFTQDEIDYIMKNSYS